MHLILCVCVGGGIIAPMIMREVAGQKYGTEMPPGASTLAQIDMISILSFHVHLLLPIGIFCLPLFFCDTFSVPRI